MSDSSAAYDKYMKQIPVMPDAAVKIMGMAEEGSDVSFTELERTIKIDPGLTTKILKVANSAMYARQREIKNLQMAISLLGLKNIRSLVLLVAASGLFRKDGKSDFYNNFWQHAVTTAFLSKHIATRTRHKELAEEVFLGGLLHDIGQSALYNSSGEEYVGLLEESRNSGIQIEELEKGKYGIDHRDLGSALLTRWFFPEIYADMASEHTSVNITSNHKTAIVIVSSGDLVSSILGHGFGTPNAEDQLQLFLRLIKLSGQDLDYYRNSYLSDLKEDPLFQECQSLFGLKI